MTAKKIVVAILAALVLILTVQNATVVTLRFFFWKLEMSRIFVVLLSAVVGGIIGYVVRGSFRARRT